LVDEQECTLTGHSLLVTSVAYSPDGKHIVSGSYDNTVKIWDAATGEEVCRPVLTMEYRLLLRALVLTCEVGP
jgi:WD40 repeat protein